MSLPGIHHVSRAAGHCSIIVYVTPPDDAHAMNIRNKFYGLLVGSWLAVGFVSVAQADFADGLLAYKQTDFATAFKEFKSLAEQGSADAQWYLGRMYVFGQGIPEDYKKAVKWTRKAADQGHARAQFDLGRLFRTGRGGVPKDYVLAYMWYSLAANHGWAAANLYRDGIAKELTSEQIAEAQ